MIGWKLLSLGRPNPKISRLLGKWRHAFFENSLQGLQLIISTLTTVFVINSNIRSGPVCRMSAFALLGMFSGEQHFYHLIDTEHSYITWLTLSIPLSPDWHPFLYYLIESSKYAGSCCDWEEEVWLHHAGSKGSSLATNDQAHRFQTGHHRLQSQTIEATGISVGSRNGLGTNQGTSIRN